MKLKVSGIYSITNTVTGEVYVGQSINLLGRKESHFRALSTGKHPNKKLQNDFSTYGRDSFVIHREEFCPVELLCEREAFYIKLLGATYNLASPPMRIRRDGPRFNPFLQDLRRWRRGQLQRGDNPGLAGA